MRLTDVENPMLNGDRPPMKVGIVGLGLIGRQLAALFRDRKPSGLTLHSVTVRDPISGRAQLDALGLDTPILPLQDMAREVDIIAETARAAALRGIVEAAFAEDRTLVCVSAAGLIECQDLIAQSAATGRGRLIVASGGMPGLDCVRAACEAGVLSFQLESRFTVPALAHEEYVINRGFDLTQPFKDPIVVFEGSAIEAAKAFPRHFNVGMTLQVATRSEVDIRIRLIADPSLTGPIHHLEIETPSGGFSLECRNVLTAENRASRIVAPSIMAALRRLVDPMSAGS